MSRWVNFERWFEFEKDPRVEKVIAENIESPKDAIESELRKYEYGLLE